MKVKLLVLPPVPPTNDYTPLGTIELIFVSFHRPAAVAAAVQILGQSFTTAGMKYLAASSSLCLLFHYLFTLPLKWFHDFTEKGVMSHRGPKHIVGQGNVLLLAFSPSTLCQTVFIHN